jgi:hypothetical protein
MGMYLRTVIVLTGVKYERTIRSFSDFMALYLQKDNKQRRQFKLSSSKEIEM